MYIAHSVTARFIKQLLGAFCFLLPVIFCLDLSAFLFSTPLSPACSIQVEVLHRNKKLGAPFYHIFPAVQFSVFLFRSNSFAQNNTFGKQHFSKSYSYF
jgi:hypothetical protein